MKLYTLLAVLFCACGISNITYVEATCARCVQAREYNANHANEYFYYEDYVEAQKQQ